MLRNKIVKITFAQHNGNINTGWLWQKQQMMEENKERETMSMSEILVILNTQASTSQTGRIERQV